MKKALRWLCPIAFALLCALVLAFLRQFTAGGETYTYPAWEKVWQVGEDGELTALPADGDLSAMAAGGRYRLETELSDLPEDACLLLNYAGAETVVYIDGREVFRCASPGTPAGTSGTEAVQLPLPAAAGGCTLAMDFRVLDPDACMYPPLVRVTSTWLEEQSSMAYANLYGIPAGAFAVAFLLVCGLLLLGFAMGLPDWRLTVLALAAAMLLVYEISRSCGYYFLSTGLQAALGWAGFAYLAPALLLLYILLNLRRGYLRSLGGVSAVAAALLACAALVSWGADGYLFKYLRQLFFQQLPAGVYSGLVYWLTVYLTFACAGISAYGFSRVVLRTRMEAQALADRQRLTLESYHATLEQNQKTAALRHEWNNQITALHLLLREGKLEALEQKLGELEENLRQLAPRHYTGSFALDAILQSAAARAGELGVDFRVDAHVPAEPAMDEGDLCSLMLNMLDNALEAAANVPPPGKREVRLRIHAVQGFLAVSCENTCAGEPLRDGEGRIVSAKGEGHGLGLGQMRAVAEKYHSMLDISCGGGRFTVQTALKL